MLHYEKVCGKEATNRLHLLERTVLLLRNWYSSNKPKRVLPGIDIKISIWDLFGSIWDSKGWLRGGVGGQFPRKLIEILCQVKRCKDNS